MEALKERRQAIDTHIIRINHQNISLGITEKEGVHIEYHDGKQYKDCYIVDENIFTLLNQIKISLHIELNFEDKVDFIMNALMAKFKLLYLSDLRLNGNKAKIEGYLTNLVVVEEDLPVWVSVWNYISGSKLIALNFLEKMKAK